MRPSRPTAIRSKKNSCGDRHARRREAERRSRESALVLVDDRQPPMTRSGRHCLGDFLAARRDWLKFKNPDAPAVTREAEEDWGR